MKITRPIIYTSVLGLIALGTTVLVLMRGGDTSEADASSPPTANIPTPLPTPPSPFVCPSLFPPFIQQMVEEANLTQCLIGNASRSLDMALDALSPPSVTSDPDPDTNQFHPTDPQGMPPEQLVEIATQIIQKHANEQEALTHALELYQIAADTGYVEAARALARCYTDGTGTLPNTTLAQAWWERAAKSGDAEAQYQMAHLTPQEEIAVNYADSNNWLQLSANQNYPPALYEMAVFLRAGELMPKDEKKALAYFQKAAALNSSKAKVALGKMYLSGSGGVKKDTSKGLELLEMAAIDNEPTVFAELAAIYETGIGNVQLDLPKALEYKRYGAELEDSTCQFLYAKAVFQGDHVEKNPTLGLRWLIKSADAGNAHALTELGLLYLRGKEGLLEANPVYAVELLEKAATKQDINAYYVLGTCLLMGYGCEESVENQERAMQLMQNAAVQGNVKAMTNLGVIYMEGLGTSYYDLEEAIRWSKQAAEKGDASAQCNLGTCYRRKFEASKQPALRQEAIKWYQRAYRNGETSAAELLREMGVTPTATPDPTVKPTTKPAAKPVTKPVAKPTTKPVDKPTTKPAAKPNTKPAGNR